MKLIRILSLVLFASVLLVPLACFNWEPNSVSPIDNRVLTENPFTLDGDRTSNIQNYVNDRIGLRDEMITVYTVLNDKLFNKMVHPSYTYGKDGYVFGAGLTTGNDFWNFHVAFADLVLEIQTYCAERDVPFLFVFNPAKPAVYQDKVASGLNYDRQWVDLFFAELDKRGVNYLDNTETFQSLREEGINGFNQKYDANHWNDLGAYYGTAKMQERMRELCPNLPLNSLEEFTVSQTLQTSLPVSKFPIKEYVPEIASKASITSLYDAYFPEIEMHPSYRNFGYYVNDSEKTANAPKALVFQGSYMNGHGSKYLQNAFREYVHVHDYQNVINFPYYFNIFQPDCVIFEVAEYTFSELYFDYENMCNVDYNPVLDAAADKVRAVDLFAEAVTVEQGDVLTVITWNTDTISSYVWLSLDCIYDMQRTENGYRATVETKRYESSKDRMEIYVAVP